jgi:hypothetical protein
MPDPAFPDGDSVITLDSNNGEVVIGGPPGGVGHRGHLVIADADGNPMFSVDGATGETSQRGDIVLLDNAGNERIRIMGQGAEIVIKNASSNDTILVDGDEGDIVVRRKIGGLQRDVLRFDASHAALYVGSQDNEGDIIVRNNAGQDSVHIDGNEGDVILRRDVGGTLREVFRLDTSNAAFYVGCEGNEGDIVIRDNDARPALHFDGNAAALYVGTNGNEGDIIVRNSAGQDSVHIDGNEGDVIIRRDVGGALREVFRLDTSNAAFYVGCEGNEGDIVIRDDAARPALHFDGNSAALYVGANGNEGDVIVRNNAGQNSVQIDGNEGDIIVRRDVSGSLLQVMKFDASHAALYLGSQGNEGDIFVRNNAGQNSVHVDGNEGDVIIRRDIGGNFREVFKLDASNAALYVGCAGNEGDIVVRDGAGRSVFHFDSAYAALYVGANGNEGDVIVRDGAGNERIRLDGGSGDIRLQGADCAEQFEVVEPETIEPGTVLVIDDDSRLRPCELPYDRKVAGVVSGANGFSPGIVMDDSLAPDKRLPVALNGKVYCKVDAGFSPIEVGDLLTTSPVEGHAMKAADQSKAFGAVIGKALGSLDTGCGLIPVLVSLQ